MKSLHAAIALDGPLMVGLFKYQGEELARVGLGVVARIDGVDPAGRLIYEAEGHRYVTRECLDPTSLESTDGVIPTRVRVHEAVSLVHDQLPGERVIVSTTIPLGMAEDEQAALEMPVTRCPAPLSFTIERVKPVPRTLAAWLDWVNDSEGREVPGRQQPWVFVDIGFGGTTVMLINPEDPFADGCQEELSFGWNELLANLTMQLRVEYGLGEVRALALLMGLESGVIHVRGEPHFLSPVASSILEPLAAQVSKVLSDRGWLNDLVVIGPGAGALALRLESQVTGNVSVPPGPMESNARGLLKVAMFAEPAAS